MLMPERVTLYQSLIDRMSENHACMGLPYVPCDACKAAQMLSSMFPGVISALLSDRAELAGELRGISASIPNEGGGCAALALDAIVARLEGE